MSNRTRVVSAWNDNSPTSNSRPGRAVVEWFFYGHLAIPLIAAGLTASALLVAGAGWSWRALLLSAAGANFVYQLESLGSSRREDLVNQPGRVAWRERNIGYALASLTISAAIVLSVLAISPERLVLVAVGLGAVGILYASPLLPGGTRLKRYRYAKPTMIAAAWSVGTVLLPLLVVGRSGDATAIVMLTTYRFLFLLPNALCSDLTDVVGDREAGLRTVASTLGVRVTKFASLIFASAAAVLLAAFVVVAGSGGAAGWSATPQWVAIELFGLLGTVLAIASYERLADRGMGYRWLLDGSLLWFLAHVAVLRLI